MFAVLFVAAFWLLDQAPKFSASDAQWLAFLNGPQRWVLLVAGTYLVPFSGIAFLWFFAAFRQRELQLTDSRDSVFSLFSTMRVMSAVLFVGIVFAAGAAVASLAGVAVTGSTASEAGQVRTLELLGQTLVKVFALRCAAIFVAISTTCARRVGLFPRWFVLLSYLVAAFLLLATSYRTTFALVFPLWVLVVSLLVMRRLPEKVLGTTARGSR